MKLNIRLLIGVILLAVFLAPLSRSAAETRATVGAPNVFSYQVPAGWKLRYDQGEKYPSATDVKDEVIMGNISVDMETQAGALNEWFKNSLAKQKAQYSSQYAHFNPHIGNPTPFVTTTGTKGFRVVIRLTVGEEDIVYVFYYFAGNSNVKILVTCFSAPEDADHYAPLFDAAMKTFVAH